MRDLSSVPSTFLTQQSCTILALMKILNVCLIPTIAILAFSSATFANTPICVSSTSDSDGDGWGWENGESCSVSGTAIQAPTIQSTTICSSPGADPDGDGWGWENNASCMIEASSGTNGTGNSTTGNESGISGITTCSSSSSDQDGDGWGWENNSSCVVVSPTANSTPANDDRSTVTSGTPPPCSSAAFDVDGDGWGWEKGASCQVVANATDNLQISPQEAQVTPDPSTLPPCSIPALDSDNDGIGRENNQDCAVQAPISVRIMALGDSITHGSRTGSAESYRKPFDALMTSNACQFEMVGSQTGNYLHNTYVSPHEGYNGHTADHILNGNLNSNAGNNEGISVTSARYQPHVVLLHIGSNDMRLGQDIGQTVAEIDQIISVILSSNSTPVVFLANVIPWYRSATVGADVQLLGDRIEAYVAQLNDPRVRLVDVRTGFTRSMILNDNVHPNPTGEQLIADRFFAAYNSAGFCR